MKKKARKKKLGRGLADIKTADMKLPKETILAEVKGQRGDPRFYDVKYVENYGIVAPGRVTTNGNMETAVSVVEKDMQAGCKVKFYYPVEEWGSFYAGSSVNPKAGS